MYREAEETAKVSNVHRSHRFSSQRNTFWSKVLSSEHGWNSPSPAATWQNLQSGWLSALAWASTPSELLLYPNPHSLSAFSLAPLPTVIFLYSTPLAFLHLLLYCLLLLLFILRSFSFFALTTQAYYLLTACPPGNINVPEMVHWYSFEDLYPAFYCRK